MTVKQRDPSSGVAGLGLQGVSLEVAAGEAVALVGRNGAGKTTLIMAVAGLVPVLRGDLTLGGRDVWSAATGDPRWLRSRVGVAFQFPERSFFAATVRDELAFTSARLGRSPEEIEWAVRHSLARVGLGDDLLGRSPFTLSGGEKRRVGLAAAIAHEPSILLLDEPEVGLDRSGVAAVCDLIRNFKQDGGSVVVATHEVATAMTWADRYLILDGGELRAEVDAWPTCEGLGVEPLGEWLWDRGAMGKIQAEARTHGIELPSPYRQPLVFLERLSRILGCDTLCDRERTPGAVSGTEQ